MQPNPFNAFTESPMTNDNTKVAENQDIETLELKARIDKLIEQEVVIPLEYIVSGDFPFDWLIKDFLPKKESLLLVGASGIGKSMFTLYLAMAGAVRKKLWGRFEVVEPLRTLFVQSENSINTLQARAKNMLQKESSLKKSMGSVFFKSLKKDGEFTGRYTGDLLDDKFIEDIVMSARFAEANLIVFDPLISFHSVDEDKNVAMRVVLDRLTKVIDETGASLIVVHHTGKKRYNQLLQARGASAIRDWCDNMLNIEAKGDYRIELTFTKRRNVGEIKPFILYRTENLTYEYLSETEKKGNKLRKMIRKTVKNWENENGKKECSKNAVAVRLEGKFGSLQKIRREIEKMIKEGELEYEHKSATRGILRISSFGQKTEKTDQKN